MSSSVKSVPRSLRHAAPSVRRSIASRHVHTARGVHTTKATQRGAYTPYHQSYFGQHMVGCCPDTGLATGMTVSPNSRAASTSGTSQPSAPSYAPYFRSYYGTHMLDRTGGVRHMSTRPTRPALRAESSASAAVPEDAPGVGAEHIVLQSRPAKREAPAATATAAADGPLAALSDAEVLEKLQSGEAPHHQLEVLVGDSTRAVELRRAFLGLDDPQRGGALPVSHFDTGSFYDQVKGANCENVVGFLTIPVGVVGPLVLDGEPLTVPMATTEGALIASTNRGARAIALSGGARSAVMRDGMTRAPAVQMPSVMEAARMRAWLEQPEVVEELKGEFSQTTRFGKLQTVDTYVAGRNVFIRFRCNTGDAMGMNMISKGVERVMARVSREFPEARVLALSGNVCMDKKPSAMNWIEGRGKSVAVEAILPGHVVTSVLKTTVADMVELNISKNLIGSAVAGSIGGNNAHASNIVSACFLATGQDPAQNVESSNCMTLMEPVNDGQDLHISCTMPSIEVGTVGGGTALPTQAACLDMLNVRGAAQIPGQHAQKLARVICATVLAGEISLMGALASGHLVSSHMRLNRAAPKKA